MAIRHDNNFSKSAEPLAKNVQTLRMAKGWTPVQLARKLGWGQPRVSELESGRFNRSIRYLDELAKVFKVKPHELPET